ncbi:unnamed protein product [Phaeothamnion confervicola]
MFETRLEDASKLRALGNERFKAGDVAGATEVYRRALHHVDMDELQVPRRCLIFSQKNPLQHLQKAHDGVLNRLIAQSDEHRTQLLAGQLPILLNLCQCLMRSGSDAAVEAASLAKRATECDRQCAKAWFWRGRARTEAGVLDGAEGDLREALRLSPDDRAIRVAISTLRIKKMQQQKATRAMWRNVFGSGSAATSDVGGGGGGSGGPGSGGAARPLPGSFVGSALADMGKAIRPMLALMMMMSAIVFAMWLRLPTDGGRTGPQNPFGDDGDEFP